MLIALPRSLKTAFGSAELRSYGFWQNPGKRSFEVDLQAKIGRYLLELVNRGD